MGLAIVIFVLIYFNHMRSPFYYALNNEMSMIVYLILFILLNNSMNFTIVIFHLALMNNVDEVDNLVYH